MMRPLQESDLPEIRRLYDASEHRDGWPDFLQMEDAQVVVQNGEIVAVAGARMVPEMVLILGKGHPAERLYWLKLLYGRMLEFLRERGLKRCIAFVPPQIERAYGRRLGSMGFQPGLSVFVYLAEEKDVTGIRDKIGTAGE
jgi:hypothetical protein